MNAISKFIYKRTPQTKNTIVVLEDEKGEKFYHFICLFLFDNDKVKPSENSKVIRYFKDKVLYREDIFLSQISVEALVFVRNNPDEFTGQVVKLKPKQ